YFAKSWRDEKKAFASIRDDLAHLYSFSYYPKPNPNRGWRSIKVQLVGDRLKKYHVDEERISSQTEPVFYRQCASRVCAELIQQNRANVDIWKQLSSLPFYQAILIPSLATLSQAFHSGPGGH